MPHDDKKREELLAKADKALRALSLWIRFALKGRYHCPFLRDVDCEEEHAGPMAKLLKWRQEIEEGSSEYRRIGKLYSGLQPGLGELVDIDRVSANQERLGRVVAEKIARYDHELNDILSVRLKKHVETWSGIKPYLAGQDRMLPPLKAIDGRPRSIKEHMGQLGKAIRRAMNALKDRAADELVGHVLVKEMKSPSAGEGVTLSEAALSKAGDKPQYFIHRKGSKWEVAFGEERAYVQKHKGMSYIAFLVGSPDHPFSPGEVEEVELLKELGLTPAKGNEEAGLTASRDDGARIDKKGRISLQKKLIGLRAEMSDAKSQEGQEWRVVDAEKEIAAIMAQLRADTNLAGKDRKLGNTTYQIQDRVSRCISRAIDALEEAPLCRDHLTAKVQHGEVCRYNSDPHHPIHWDISLA